MPNRIDYEAIRLYHRVDGILNNEETARRLREVANCYYPAWRTLSRVASSRSKTPTKTEQAILSAFPVHGLDMKFCSNGLMFADCFRHMSKPEHKAIIALVRLGYLAIVEGYRVERTADGFVRCPGQDYPTQILARVQ